MCADVAESDSRLNLPPELNAKIDLNNLGQPYAIILRRGAQQTGHIERYFKANSAFALSELRDHVVGHYEAAKRVLAMDPPTEVPHVDAVFQLFRRSLFPKGATAATVLAVDAVIGYFFEACDVFDPAAPKDLPGASP
jgi:hypothetical protein